MCPLKLGLGGGGGIRFDKYLLCGRPESHSCRRHHPADNEVDEDLALRQQREKRERAQAAFDEIARELEEMVKALERMVGTQEATRAAAIAEAISAGLGRAGRKLGKLPRRRSGVQTKRKFTHLK